MKVTMLGRSYAYANAPLSRPVSVPSMGTSFYPYLHNEQQFGAEPWEMGSQDTLATITDQLKNFEPAKSNWTDFILGLSKIGADTAVAIVQQKQAQTTDARDSQRLNQILDNIMSGRNPGEGLTLEKAAPWAIGGAVVILAAVVLMTRKKGRRR